jgi:DNA repair exonuclease SbcCD ATPase subunit
MVDLITLGGRVKHAERRMNQLVGEARSILAQGAQAEEEVAALEAREATLNEAIGVLNSYADASQERLQRQIEALVSHGLRLIFDDQDMTFALRSNFRGKLAVTDFVIRSTLDGQEIETSVLDARGGGVAAVVGFILRVVLLLLRSDADRILFLDESFAQVSADYEPKVAEFLRELCDRTGIRIVLVAHSDAFNDVADVAYRFRLENGRTVVTKEG